nr:hypothetical transcript [Hymenolepis microstoma]
MILFRPRSVTNRGIWFQHAVAALPRSRTTTPMTGSSKRSSGVYRGPERNGYTNLFRKVNSWIVLPLNSKATCDP